MNEYDKFINMLNESGLFPNSYCCKGFGRFPYDAHNYSITITVVYDTKEIFVTRIIRTKIGNLYGQATTIENIIQNAPKELRELFLYNLDMLEGFKYEVKGC